MSSTKPTTSADRIVSWLAASLIAAVALAVAVQAVRHAQAARAGQQGVEALTQALSLPRGAERDDRLHEAQASLTEALAVSQGDPDLWIALARTRYMQATAAQVSAVSPRLAEAAAAAAERAFALAPTRPEPPARLAQARSLLGADAAEIAAPLMESYRLAQKDRAMGAWRAQIAFQVWSALDGGARRAAIDEACLIAQDSKDGYARWFNMAMQTNDPSLAVALDTLITDAECQPDPNA